MGKDYRYIKINKSRVATFDIYAVGLYRHHVSALLEFDVTDSRKKIRELRRTGHMLSFNSWIIKVVSKAIALHPEAASFLCSKKKLISFNDINVSIMVEKEVNGNKVPIPLVIEKANKKSISEIFTEIEDAKNSHLSEDDMVINKGSSAYERLYYRLPGFIRRLIWRIMLCNPRVAYKKMGNVIITSPGMMGKINGWFIHKTVHPVSFGIGSVIKKPVVINDEIKVREILNMTVLIDHDVIDGAPMVRFLNDLTRFIESDEELG